MVMRLDLARAATLSLLMWGCNALLGIEQRELVEGSGATHSGGSESGGKSNNAGTGDTSSGGDDAGAGEPGSGGAGNGSAGSATGGTDGTAGSSGGTDGTSGSPPTGGTGGGGSGGSDSGGAGTGGGGSGGTDTGPVCLDIDGGSTDSATCTTYCADAVAHCSGEASAEGKVPTTPQCKTFCQTFTVPQLCCRAYHAKNAEIAADPHCAHTVGSGLCQ